MFDSPKSWDIGQGITRVIKLLNSLFVAVTHRSTSNGRCKLSRSEKLISDGVVAPFKWLDSTCAQPSSTKPAGNRWRESRSGAGMGAFAPRISLKQYNRKKKTRSWLVSDKCVQSPNVSLDKRRLPCHRSLRHLSCALRIATSKNEISRSSTCARLAFQRYSLYVSCGSFLAPDILTARRGSESQARRSSGVIFNFNV